MGKDLGKGVVNSRVMARHGCGPGLMRGGLCFYGRCMCLRERMMYSCEQVADLVEFDRTSR